LVAGRHPNYDHVDYHSKCAGNPGSDGISGEQRALDNGSDNTVPATVASSE
jgi:hypothetical protein